MKFIINQIKNITLAIILFTSPGCVFFGGLFTDIPTPEPATYVSEGSIAAPVQITGIHNGTVDGTNSSYYVFYGSGGTSKTINLYNLTSDVDLYVYLDNSTFTTPSFSSLNTGQPAKRLPQTPPAVATTSKFSPLMVNPAPTLWKSFN